MGIRRVTKFLFAAVIVMLLMSGCSRSLTDDVTEKKIPVIDQPGPELTHVKVNTDGMLSEVGYGYPHPFGLNQEVLVDFHYYEQHDISRGDIVVFRTKDTSYQTTDLARVVGLPGEKIGLKKGQAYINGHKLKAFYGNDAASKNNISLEKPLVLQRDQFFILADVRWRGFNDSQTAGPYSRDDILGKVVGY
ncbi:signal peptidase I [Paenibacillus sp. YAF4_2]|uniref:signal peptidase I n=1 Tax=Paenibacillus sp. YAF4_2 TaxID=3233085 RepID=UPI003F9478AD